MSKKPMTIHQLNCKKNFNPEHTYWNSKGKYQHDFEEYSKLMPVSGNCETVAGELIRAANRLCWDFYNNGMGNNTTGALNFLSHIISHDTFKTIKPFTNGRLYKGRFEGDEFHIAIESMIDQVVNYINENPHLINEPNTDDIFNYEEETKW